MIVDVMNSIIKRFVVRLRIFYVTVLYFWKAAKAYRIFLIISQKTWVTNAIPKDIMMDMVYLFQYMPQVFS